MKHQSEIEQYYWMLTEATRKEPKAMHKIIQNINAHAWRSDAVKRKFRKLVKVGALEKRVKEGGVLEKFVLTSKGAKLRSHLREASKALNDV